jgi:hypothetical protein
VGKERWASLTSALMSDGMMLPCSMYSRVPSFIAILSLTCKRGGARKMKTLDKKQPTHVFLNQYISMYSGMVTCT